MAYHCFLMGESCEKSLGVISSYFTQFFLTIPGDVSRFVWLCCIVVGKGVNRSSVLHVYFIAD